MRIIITDIDSGEEEIIRVSAPREDQYLADETVRARREFAIDAVILEGLKFMGTHRYIASPNSRQNPEMYPNLSALSASECEAISRNIREETQAIGEALFHPPCPLISPNCTYPDLHIEIPAHIRECYFARYGHYPEDTPCISPED